mmetsp:Transcript_4182/g.11963  ORF Transcript_4182/g.11963 Transcript_4182/m.11963 type:complete len:215 (-) Transcript_4182:781-1425(-)
MRVAFSPGRAFWHLAPVDHGSDPPRPRAHRRLQRFLLRHRTGAKLVMVEVKRDRNTRHFVQHQQIIDRIAVGRVVVLNGQPRTQTRRQPVECLGKSIHGFLFIPIHPTHVNINLVDVRRLVAHHVEDPRLHLEVPHRLPDQFLVRRGQLDIAGWVVRYPLIRCPSELPHRRQRVLNYGIIRKVPQLIVPSPRKQLGRHAIQVNAPLVVPFNQIE